MSEDEVYLRTTTLLAEHLGFAPIEAIDDIINVINDIMYTCTEQLERILTDRIDKLNEKDKYSQKDVEKGTAQLESLLEHVINKNFDKFELYAFRNVFNIPVNLIENGCILLRHHEDMDLDPNIDRIEHELLVENTRLLERLSLELERNQVLSKAVKELKPIYVLCRTLRTKLSALDAKSELYEQAKVKAMSPLRDTIIYIVNKIQEIYNSMNKLRNADGEGLANERLKELVRRFDLENNVFKENPSSAVLNKSTVKELVELLS